MLSSSEGKKKPAIDAQKIKTETRDFIKDPYVLEFLNLSENAQLLESRFEQAILSNLQAFLLEMGKGFSFVARQFRIIVPVI
ncbi:PDDEXK nuclease domain-containing protein [uncultured Desulfobacter sp.]|uniref:PDDEXK nuclease domain-containing protein n=1 Tax=uncultured Desulfobacter sp. TaxID=240139 RepID=UPI002AA8876F|nr:PDDEXK nuclease domain-containing protein [uncultured Desulfobacter sp.]